MAVQVLERSEGQQQFLAFSYSIHTNAEIVITSDVSGVKNPQAYCGQDKYPDRMSSWRW